MAQQRYRQIRVPRDHPLARVNLATTATKAVVYEHRLVLWDKIGPGVHPCHWCGTEVEWNVAKFRRRLEVDHVDADKWNNAPDNLVPACRPCNLHRPGAHPFDRVTGDEPHIVRIVDGRAKRIRCDIRHCETCGRPFLVVKAEGRVPGHGRFCSRDCHYASRRTQT